MAKKPTDIALHMVEQGILKQGSGRFAPKPTAFEPQHLAFLDEVIAALYDKPYQCMLKRTMDIVLCVLSLVVVLPMMAVAAICIKLDSAGPVFYAQVRVAKNGRPFKMYKLRSMEANAEQKRDALEHLNETDGVIFKIKADPRVTRVGRFIRKYSIDELPQIWNVLKGDMTLVGPRPLPMENVVRFQSHHFHRLKVPQGLTGPWQVHGRSDMSDFDEIYTLELDYIRNWSLWQDVVYIAKTVGVVFTGKGAC